MIDAILAAIYEIAKCFGFILACGLCIWIVYHGCQSIEKRQEWWRRRRVS